MVIKPPKELKMHVIVATGLGGVTAAPKLLPNLSLIKRIQQSPAQMFKACLLISTTLHLLSTAMACKSILCVAIDCAGC